MPRLFIAIPTPEAVQDALFDLREDDIPAARWVQREQLHLTLRFLGDTDDEQTEKIQEKLADIQFQPFEIECRGLGQFPPNKPPRVLWAGIKYSDALFQLQGAVEYALLELGYTREKNRFFPHITLARFREIPRHNAVGKYIHKHATFHTSPFLVDAFNLYASELTPKGAQYTKLKTYPAS